MDKKYVSHWSLVLVLYALITAVYGQIPQGQVLGTVTDMTGGVLPGVTVTLEDEQKGTSQSMLTSDEGVYTFSYLNSGVYRVTVELSGFKKAVYSGIQVQVAEKKRVDVELQIGEISTIVEVVGGAALVDTDSATVSGIISSREVVEMPLNGREFSQLAALMPGVRATGSYGGALITQFSTQITVGGTQAGKNSYSVDGVDNTFNVWNGPAMNPSIDSVQEFRIDKSQFAAEYGRGGANLQLVTKSGTNAFHGALWEYVRNYALNAGNYTTHQQDTLRRHQFGANIGGPIVKDQAFFFFNWESQRQSSSVQPQGSVFTDKMRTGDFSEFLPDRVISDPLTGEPFSGNIIPPERLSSTALAYMDAMMGRANLPGITNNFIRPFATTRDWDQFLGRVDYSFTDNDNLFGRFTIQPREGVSAPLGATSINHNEEFDFYNLGVGWDRAWSPTLTTETRLGYHGERLLLASQIPDQLPTDTIIGFGATQPPPERLPTVFITGFSGFQMWGFPLGFVQDSWEVVQNMSWFEGNHLIKAGFTGRWQGLDKDQGPELQILQTFNGYATGEGGADYLLGLPFSASESLQFNPAKQRYGDFSAFIQDDWKVTPNLTLNLGLRYQLHTLPSEEQNMWGNFDIERELIVLAGDRIQEELVPDPLILNAYREFFITANETQWPERTLVFGDHNNFAPRFGFAWRPIAGNKTVIRGGIGYFYILEDGNIAFNNTGTLPYTGQVATDVNISPGLTMKDPFGAAVGEPPPPSAGRARYPYIRSGYLRQISLGVQHQLPWDMVGELTFQDQQSLKLESAWNLNQAPIGPGSVASRRPYPQYSSVSMNFHDGQSHYDSLEFSVKKRSRHFTFQWSHTWSKNLQRSGPYIYAMDLWNGPANNHVPHLNKLHYLIDLPFGKSGRWLNQGGVVDAILGGWTLSGIATLHQSGSPLTITYSGDSANVGIFGVRPDRVGSGELSNQTEQAWFDTSAFVPPTEGTFGNSGTGILTGPSRRFFDAAIYKNFTLYEDVKLQFRTEFFNAFNHPNLANPRTQLNGAAFGQILTKVQDPRVIQFALRLTF